MKSLVAALLLVIGSVAGICADPTPERGFTIEKLADGVYAVVRHEPPGLATHANNVIIVNDVDVMVVDTSQSPALTREVLAALRTITRKPVRYVINTHWHDDHYIGNQVYRDAYPDVDIIAHARTLRELPAEAAANRTEMARALPGMVGRIAGALETGISLAGTPITEEERRAYHSDVEWAERYSRGASGADRPAHHRGVGPPDAARGARIIDIRSLGAGHSPGRPDRAPADRAHPDRRRSGHPAGAARRCEIVDHRLGRGAGADSARCSRRSSCPATVPSCATTPTCCDARLVDSLGSRPTPPSPGANRWRPRARASGWTTARSPLRGGVAARAFLFDYYVADSLSRRPSGKPPRSGLVRSPPCPPVTPRPPQKRQPPVRCTTALWDNR